MNENQKNRFGIWLLGVIPIACTGWFSVCVWSMIQLYLYFRENKNEIHRKDIREKKSIQARQTKNDRLYTKIEEAKEFGYDYEIIAEEVVWIDKKSKN